MLGMFIRYTKQELGQKYDWKCYVQVAQMKQLSCMIDHEIINYFDRNIVGEFQVNSARKRNNFLNWRQLELKYIPELRSNYYLLNNLTVVIS